MKILLITGYFPPEIGSASHLFFDMGREFVRRGHTVTALTGYPTYNMKPENLDQRYKSGFWMREQMEGMTVVRTRSVTMPRTIPVLRGIDQVATSLEYAISGAFLAGPRPDIILIYSPPLFLGLTGLSLRLLRGGKVVTNVQDLFPQAAIDLGLLRHPLLIKLLRAVEAFIYRRSNAVTVHSPGNKTHVVRCGGVESQTHVVPNVVDTKAILPGNRENDFRRRYNIPASEFVVSFAGVLGYSQDLDTVIDAASHLKHRNDVVFYIVGDGVEKERLMQKAAGMANVRFLPMLPKEEYTTLLHASDICLATLRSQVKTPVVPSKILSIMAAGRPIVAALPLEGDAPRIIQDAQCGMCVAPEQPEQLAAAIASIADAGERAREYGVRGREYVEKNFSLEVCVTRYEEIFRGL